MRTVPPSFTSTRRPRAVERRQTISEEGATAPRVHILLAGWACRSKLPPDGHREITDLILPGDACHLHTGVVIGEMGGRLRAYDWASSPLGSPDTWSAQLRTCLSLVLNSVSPNYIAWGPELSVIYNDAYRPLLLDKHPTAFGQSFREVWAEAWDTIGPIVHSVMNGEALMMSAVPFRVERGKGPEDILFTFACSPVRNDDGVVLGFYGSVIEEATGPAEGAPLEDAAGMARRILAASSERVAERAGARDQLWLSAPDMLSVASTDGRFLACNPMWTSVLGWTEGELLAMPFLDLLHPDDWERTAVGLGGLTRGEAVLGFENRYRHKDGSYRWLSWNAALHDGRIVSTTRDVTAERNQGAELAERTLERDRMWETSPDLMLVIDFAGYFRRMSPASTPVLGYQPEELVGRHVNEFVLEDDHDATNEAVAEAAHGGQPRLVNRYRHKDGSARWISWIGVPQGEMIYATGRDITLEREGARANARLRAMADAAPILIWETDREGVTFVNQHYLDFFGASFDQIKAMGWSEFLHPDDLDGYVAAYTDGFTKRQPYAYECRFRRADGEYRWMRNTGTPVGEDRFAGGTVDVTDLLEAQSALKQGEERLFLEGVRNHAIITTDPAGTITRWSAGAQTAFGWSAEEALGQPADIIFTPEDRAAGVPAQELAAAEREGCANDERWHLTKDGGRAFMNGSVHPLPRDAQGRARGFIKIARDETERRRTEAALCASETLARESGQRVQLALAAGAIIGTWHWDLPTDQFTVDEAFADAFGLDPALGREGIPLARIVATVHPDDQAGLAEAINEAIARGGPYAHQYRTLRADGSYYWLEANGRVEHGPDGTPLSFPGVLIDVHERRAVEAERDRANTAQRERETRLSMAVEAGEIGEWELDLATNTSIRARRHDQIFGYDTLIRDWGVDTFLGHVLPEDRAATEAAFTQAAETGTGWNFQCRIRRAGDDAVRWIAASSAPQLDEAGRTVKLFGMVQDITDQKTAELGLRELNEELKTENLTHVRELNSMWNVTRDPLAIADMQGRLVAINPAWTVTLGWTEAEVLGATSEWLEHPDDKQKTRDETVSLSEGNTSFAFVHRLRTRAGDYRMLSWACVPEGERIYCSARDVTEERANAAALAERTAERDRIWETSPDLMVVVDFEGVFRRVNPAWTTVLGYQPEELVGRHVNEFVQPEHHDATAEAVAEAAHGRQLRIVNAYRHKDGTARWISWTAAPQGELTYATGRDITAEREQSAALAQAEDALRQSQKMEAVGQLTGGLAHDFNNLLAGISGSLELMQTRMQQGRFQDVERYMAAAQGASKRAAALTHRLLAFSRRQTLDPKPTDVTRLAMGMQEMIQRTVGPGIPVEVVGATTSWPALVDPSQLENALLNLCINARDAMPDGGSITVETANKWMDERAARQHDMPEGQYLSLSVTDTGTGMPPEVVARVFEPFFTTKPLGEGTGLGLSMIYGFAQQSGGQVRIYSEIGQGTTVCIYLPRHYGAVAIDKAVEKAAELPRSREGETVLVVDDEPTVRMLVTDVLEDLGYGAIEAGDSATGLKILQSDVRIDLLVTDVGLPGGMNGRQMADAARVARPDLKVLFITGYAENALLGAGQLKPGMAVLTKPFAMGDMAARIRSMIVAGKAQSSGAKPG